MPIPELGLQPGKALPAPAVAAAAGGMVMNAAGLWVYPPGHLLAVDLGAAYSNSAAETTILAGGATAGIFPAGVAGGDAVQIRAAGKWLNNSGGTQTLTLNIYMGGTLIATVVTGALAASANPRDWQVELEVIYSIIGGAGAGAIRPMGQIVVAGTGTGFQSLAATSAYFFNEGASQTIATNAAATGDLKAQTSNGTATTTVTCNIFRARYFPKNY